MRVDHFAYQQATRVAGFGLLFQLAIGLTLMLYGIIGRDTTMTIGALSKELTVGAQCRFHVFSDDHGLGAEECGPTG